MDMDERNHEFARCVTDNRIELVANS